MTSRKIPESAVENLVSDLEGKANIALTNSPYTTNRILEIPQDIKLELNNGTLTLKAGSKVYVPNGFEADGTTPKFDVVTIENDIHAGGKLASFTDKWIFGYRNNGFYWEILSHCFSGSTLPTQTGENRLGYNTTVNKFQGSINGGAYIDDISSFPICIFSTNSGVITSIDQIFNGFGYIGSTVFALSGVKGQIPNGRNGDGTCKNIIFTNDSVKIWTEPNVTRATGMWLSSSGVGCSHELYYYSKDNINKNILDNTTRQNCKVANVFATNGKITSFEPYTVDSVVNSSASNFSQAGRETIVGWGIPDYSAVVSMPSGSSAPKNGWAVAHGNNETVVYSVNGVSVAQGTWYPGAWSGNWNLQIMVSAGDVVTGGGWKFIPCKGVN